MWIKKKSEFLSEPWDRLTLWHLVICLVYGKPTFLITVSGGWGRPVISKSVIPPAGASALPDWIVGWIILPQKEVEILPPGPHNVT